MEAERLAHELHEAQRRERQRQQRRWKQRQRQLQQFQGQAQNQGQHAPELGPGKGQDEDVEYAEVRSPFLNTHREATALQRRAQEAEERNRELQKQKEVMKGRLSMAEGACDNVKRRLEELREEHAKEREAWENETREREERERVSAERMRETDLQLRKENEEAKKEKDRLLEAAEARAAELTAGLERERRRREALEEEAKEWVSKEGQWQRDRSALEEQLLAAREAVSVTAARHKKEAMTPAESQVDVSEGEGGARVTTDEEEGTIHQQKLSGYDALLADHTDLLVQLAKQEIERGVLLECLREFQGPEVRLRE